MTEKEIERIVRETVPGGSLDCNCDNWIAVAVEGYSDNFIVNKRREVGDGEYVGDEYTAEQFRDIVAKRWQICRPIMSRGKA